MELDFGDGSEVTMNSTSSGQFSEEEDANAQLMVFYPNRQPVSYKLHGGVNVIGRQSSFAQRDANRLHDWSAAYPGVNVHGIFLESSSVSSTHALICIEERGICYAEDLKSRNKTFVKSSSKHTALHPGAKTVLRDSSSLTFGALKCRVQLGSSGVEEQSAMRGTDQSKAKPIQMRAASRSVSIGQRTVQPASTSGRLTFLDKCPSLQEWFQHPAKSSNQEQSDTAEPVVSKVLVGGEEKEKGNLPKRHSFGFGIVEHDDQTSSDGEPETPRIDRPAIRGNIRPPITPFNSDRPQLESMREDDRENQPSPDLETSALAQSLMTPKVGSDDSLSMELGAEALTQLSSRSPSPSPVSRPIDQSRLSLKPSRGSFNDLTDEEVELTRGRPRRSQQKSPTMKRSRSGRIASPEKSQPRSKSPRIQRRSNSYSDGQSDGEQHLKLDDMRAAVQDLMAKESV